MKILKRSLLFTIGLWLVMLLAACQSGTTTGNNQPYQPSGNSEITSQPTQASGQGTNGNQGNGQGNNQPQPTQASGQGTNNLNPQIMDTPNVTTVGNTTTISGDGWRATEHVHLRVGTINAPTPSENVTVVEGDTTTNALGQFSITLTIPSQAKLGKYPVSADDGAGLTTLEILTIMAPSAG